MSNSKINFSRCPKPTNLTLAQRFRQLLSVGGSVSIGEPIDDAFDTEHLIKVTDSGYTFMTLLPNDTEVTETRLFSSIRVPIFIKEFDGPLILTNKDRVFIRLKGTSQPLKEYKLIQIGKDFVEVQAVNSGEINRVDQILLRKNILDFLQCRLIKFVDCPMPNSTTFIRRLIQLQDIGISDPFPHSPEEPLTNFIPFRISGNNLTLTKGFFKGMPTPIPSLINQNFSFFTRGKPLHTKRFVLVNGSEYLLVQQGVNFVEVQLLQPINGVLVNQLIPIEHVQTLECEADHEE